MGYGFEIWGLGFRDWSLGLGIAAWGVGFKMFVDVIISDTQY